VDIKDIRNIVELMNEHGLSLLDLSHKDFHLKLKKGPDLDDLRGLLASLPAGAAAPASALAAGTLDIAVAAPVAALSVPAAPVGT